jgi:hypothetical protein
VTPAYGRQNAPTETRVYALALARIALGIVLVVRTTALANLLPVPLAHVRGELLGWPEPGWAFAWAGVTLPDSLRELLCVVRTLAALAFLFGVSARIAGVIAGVCGLIALSQDPFGFIFTLHTLFLGTIVVALTSATSCLALVPVARAESAEDLRSSVRLIWVFVGSVYAWSAIAKIQTEWLHGETLLALSEDGLLSPRVGRLLLDHRWLRIGTAWSIPVVEFALPVGLFCRRTRGAALVVAVGLHATLEIATRPDVMGWVMGALLLAFVPAGPLRWVLSLRRSQPSSA